MISNNNDKISSELSPVALLHYTCPPVIGGVEAIMAAHARLFAAHGYPVTVFAGRGPVPLQNTTGITTVIEPLIDSKGERLNRLNSELEKGIVPPDFAPYTDELYERLKIMLGGFRTCIVHNALTLHKNLALTAALVRVSETLPVKIISWCHDLAWVNPLYQPVLYDRYPWNLLKQQAPAITYVAISPQRKQEILESFEPGLTPANVPVIPNGISLEDFLKTSPNTREILRQTGLQQARLEGALLLLLPARITRRKNIELGIRVVAALKDQGANVRLVVTGPPGPHNIKNYDYVRELFALREKLDVENEVIFLMERWQEPDGSPRSIEDETIADLYYYCDALFFPSSQEGFGIPILEAGLARLPIICSDISPLVQLAGANGIYFSPEDNPTYIAGQILQRMKDDKAYHMRQEVLAKFTWDSVFEQQILPLLVKN